MDEGNEKAWLVWLVRAALTGMVGWTLYTVTETSMVVQGIRVLVAEQGHRLERLEMWRDSKKP